VIVINGGSLLLALWAFSIDGDPGDERVASSLTWSIIWPLMWPYFWLKGRNTAHARSRDVFPSPSKASSEVAPQRFRNILEAKDYLVGVIAKEAERDGTPLTEVERKMLYFTETGRTLPDMKEISAEFDRDYDQDQYEQKIASIIARVRSHFDLEHHQDQMTWDLALEKLSKGDRYLTVLVNQANPGQSSIRRNLKVLLAALLLFAVGGADFWFRHWLRDH
jgi:hypothetical protein